MTRSLRSFAELRSLRERDPEAFRAALDSCGDRLQFLTLQYGYNFHNLYENFPENEEALAKEFFDVYGSEDTRSGHVSRAVTQLFNYIDAAAEKQARYSLDPLALTFDDRESLEQRINLESLWRGGWLQQYREGLIVKERLLDFLFENKPTRADYFGTRQINTENDGERNAVVARYGRAAILNSLPPAESEKLLHEIDGLCRGLNATDLELRLNPGDFKQTEQKLYAAARDLYKRFEWALTDLCGHTLWNAHSDAHDNEHEDFQRHAFSLFIDEGEEAAQKFLSRFKVRPHIAERFLARYAHELESYTGAAAQVNSSKLEESLAERLAAAGLFFRRHVPYKAVTQTDRNYLMDFLVGQNIIEVMGGVGDVMSALGEVVGGVGDVMSALGEVVGGVGEVRGGVSGKDDNVLRSEDCFIHDELYWKKLHEKRMLTQLAGKRFVLVRSSDDLDEVVAGLGESRTPEELYHLLDSTDAHCLAEAVPHAIPRTAGPMSGRAPQSGRPLIAVLGGDGIRVPNTHFIENCYAKGYLKARR